jgi:hypothetical protein
VNFNTYWYLGLYTLSLILLVYIVFKTRDLRSFLVFLAMVGLGNAIETVIYVFLNSYQYYPKIIKYDSYFDSNMGAFASNSFSLPVTAALVAVFQLRWRWILCFIALFVGIEWLFVKIHIYSHNWWRLEYTALGLPFYYLTAKICYRRIMNPQKKLLDFWVLVLIIGGISGNFHILPIILMANRYYHPGWFDYTARDTTALAAVLYLSFSVFYLLMVRIHWKHRWIKYLITLALTHALTLLFSQLGILESFVWWDPWYYVMMSIAVLLITQMLNNYLYKEIRDSS